MNDTSLNTHYCPRCGAQLADQVDTCPSCGQALCPICGAWVDENATLCPSCGVAFELTCPDCGTLLKPEDVRCSKCGATFKGELAQPAAPAAAPVMTQSIQLHQAYLFALKQLQAKVSPEQAEEELITTGLAYSTSHTLISTLQATRRQVERAAGKRVLIYGGLWMVGGLAITLLGQALANERGGKFYILWGAVIFGALQFLIGLRLYLANAPSRFSAAAQPEIDPVMETNGYVWPAPRKSRLGWAGIVISLAIIAVLSFANLGPPLIDKPASQVNLTTADLASNFSLIDERGMELFQDKDLRDANQRTLQGGSSFVQATVLVWNQRVGDSPNTVLAGFDKPIRQNTSTAAKFDLPYVVTVGQQSGALEAFQFESQGRPGQGYVLAFVHNNVIVIVSEIGQPSTVSEQQILAHAQLIDQRLK